MSHLEPIATYSAICIPSILHILLGPPNQTLKNYRAENGQISYAQERPHITGVRVTILQLKMRTCWTVKMLLPLDI